MSTCPACGSPRNCRSVSTILSDGQTTSTHNAFTYDSASRSLNPTFMVSSTRSQLVERLTPQVSRPGTISDEKFMVYLLRWIPVCVIVLTFMLLGFPENFGWFITAFFLIGPAAFCSVILSFVTMWVLSVVKEDARNSWDAKFIFIQNCHYCYTDDVVFYKDSYASPESFVHQVFSLT
jgi:hypothetical protein